MACLYKRGKTWTYSIDIGRDKDGKRKKTAVGGFKTKKEAELAAAQMKIELEQGTYFHEQDITFREFADKWLNLYAAQVKKSSVRVRKHEINNLCHYFDQIKLKKITKLQYQNALIDLHERGFLNSTISGIHGTGRMIFKKAVELDMIKVNPTQYAKIPRMQETVESIKEKENQVKYLEKNELAHFLKVTYKAGLGNDYTIFLVLSYTGIRVGELCALQWPDIDLKNRTIRISKTYYNPNNNTKKYELLSPKTKSSQRKIEIAEKVIKELEEHRIRQNREKILHRDIWHDKDFVFCAEKAPGYPIYVKLVESRMRRLLQIAELNEGLSPHSLRHTHTSLLAEAGVGLEEIMERLGHADDQITRNVYLHVTQTMKKEAAHKFEQLMNDL